VGLGVMVWLREVDELAIDTNVFNQVLSWRDGHRHDDFALCSGLSALRVTYLNSITPKRPSLLLLGPAAKKS